MKPISTATLALSLAFLASTAAPTHAADTKKQASNAAQEQAEKNVHIVEGPSVVQVTGTSAVLKWKTDHIGANNIQYRPASGGAWKKGWVKEGSIEHWIPMKGLTPGTSYEYQVLTRDGDVRTSGKFETAATGGAASSSGGSSKGEALKITDGPRVEGTGDTWAVIAWTTNTGGSSIVHYGTDRNSLSQTAQSPYSKGEGHQTHRVRVKGLKPSTTYYFAVDSGQGQGTGTETKSQIEQFTTKGK